MKLETKRSKFCGLILKLEHYNKKSKIFADSKSKNQKTLFITKIVRKPWMKYEHEN
jgi:hypothetical protein